MIDGEAIYEAIADLEEVEREFLNFWGWNRTCNTPGSFWMWRRDFCDVDSLRLSHWEARQTPSKPQPYGVITASRSSAISMTNGVMYLLRELKGDASPPPQEQEE